ncbi:phage baseplate assembly protein V [Aeromonas veronii]|uniref:phage baseplate assembly protein V n=1 Tax=Aeromonas veronii TaxID=654 RepID=UPI00226D23C9|nr:phage baseplate assembly protein V [Aeromonas veronii]MCX9104001.1 phage baseplate assembly protein V [Aeromonas veronii]MCX9119652.1 phage baseplate assembly protein V [Aeromonas veronii]
MNDYGIGELSRQIANLIRVGEVTETDFTDPDAPRVKVAVSGFESDWLPFGAKRAGSTKTWSPLSTGEQVVILSPYGDLGQAIIVCSLYSSANPAPASSGSLDKETYPDGTTISYDSASHTLNATIGSTTINADRGQISLGVGGVTFVITAGGIDMQGGQVTHNGKNIGSDHAHSGIQRGSANSDGPI